MDAECVEWPGSRTRHGYGRIWTRDHYGQLAHRVAYEKAYGPIPEGLSVLHKCDNPPCVRPEHLFVGTRADNVADMCAKGRHGNTTKRVCKRDHPLEGDNLGVNNRGERFCRACGRLRQERYRARKFGTPPPEEP